MISMRSSRKLVGSIVVVIILVNVWYLSQRSLFHSYEPIHVEHPVATLKIDFGGASWTKDPSDSTYQDNKDSAPKDSAPKDTPKDSTVKEDWRDEGRYDAPQQAKTDPYAGKPTDSKLDIKPEDKKGDANTYLQPGEFPRNYKEGMAELTRVLDIISEITPGVPAFSVNTDYNRDIKSDSDLHDNGELPLTSEVLGMYLQVSDEHVKTLKNSHKKMWSHLPKSVVDGAFQGRGVVMTGGGKYFPMILTAIRWLRETDPDIPVEVFMSDSSEYEANICDGLFPKLNVECRVVHDIYGEALSAKLDSKYALKPLAILASKFDDIYFMDADSYPMNSILPIYDWPVYQKTGLILNADYWPRYISPKFYEIVDRPLGGRARGDAKNDHALLQSDRKNAVYGRSTESGQIYVRKSQHIQSLMLAMYWNLFGSVYYPLLMQNSPGEGDKDTFAAAAIVCNEEYYQTQRTPATLGHLRSSGEFKGFAMVQPDAVSDYERLERGDTNFPEIFNALHANLIKSNPKYLLMDQEDPIRGAPQLRQQRFFGDMKYVKDETRSNADVELRLFETMRDVTCEWVVEKKYVPRDWNTENPQRLCRILTVHVEWLKAHPDVSAPDDAPYYYNLDRDGKL